MTKNLKSIILLVVVAAIATYFYVTSNNSTLKKELSDFSVEDTASITKIFLADQNGKSILLERIDGANWQLNSKYEARQDGINNLLETIKRVRVKAPVNKAAFETVIKKLAGSGVKVEIYQNNKENPSRVYFVGGTNQEHTGTEMLLQGSSLPFLTHIEGFYGFLTPRYFVNENEWKDRTIFRYNYGSIASIKVEHPLDPKESFEIIDNGNNTFSLKDADSKIVANFDTTKVMEYVTRFKNIQYEGVEETKEKEFIEAILKTTPQQIYSVTSKTGETKACTTYMKPLKEGATDLEGNPINFDMDRMYAKVNDSDFVVIQYFLFNNLDKKLNYFLY